MSLSLSELRLSYEEYEYLGWICSPLGMLSDEQYAQLLALAKTPKPGDRDYGTQWRRKSWWAGR